MHSGVAPPKHLQRLTEAPSAHAPATSSPSSLPRASAAGSFDWMPRAGRAHGSAVSAPCPVSADRLHLRNLHILQLVLLQLPHAPAHGAYEVDFPKLRSSVEDLKHAQCSTGLTPAAFEPLRHPNHPLSNLLLLQRGRREPRPQGHLGRQALRQLRDQFRRVLLDTNATRTQSSERFLEEEMRLAGAKELQDIYIIKLYILLPYFS